MSSVKLTLRQPPNVDFVHGFPGIPAGANRQHASVKGLVELRVGGGQPIKAKYIRVELRKIETLPGGGPTNTFTEVVGTGSLNVWSAKEEWDIINTQDIPFNIRIPENVPPSVALENGGGIRYELAAEICTKIKKGLFRRDAAPVRETTAPIVIDKHELHSTWPVYLKPDVREVEKDGFHLTGERNNTCYGPGDPVVVRATLKSLTGTGTVRSYEMALRETAVFRHGPNSGTKSITGPIVRSNFIGSERLPVRVTMRPGLSDTIELKSTIPASHTTTTVVTAQHIEIVYSLAVRATIEGGTALVIDNIPVMMSNWPKNVSDTTVKKIGYAPHLSLDQTPPAVIHDAPARPASMVNNSPPPGRQTRQQRPYSIVERVGSGGGGAPAGRLDVAATLPTGIRSGPTGADEFGGIGPNSYGGDRLGYRVGTFAGTANTPLIPEDSEPALSVTGSQLPVGNESESSNKPGRSQNRYTITNADDSAAQPYMSALEEKNRLKQQQMADEDNQTASGSAVAGPALMSATQNARGRQLKQGWLSAEQEKLKQQEQARRYQQAKKVAEDTQSAAVASLQASAPHDPNFGTEVNSDTVTPSASAQSVPTPLVQPGVTSTPSPGPFATSAAASWPSAEQEKHQQLFNEAQERARRAQAAAALSNTGGLQPVNVVQSSQYKPPKPHASPPPTAVAMPAAVPQATSPPVNVVRQDPNRVASQQGTGYKVSAGATLYQSAMLAVNANNATPGPHVTTSPKPGKNALAPSPPPNGPAYASTPYVPAAASAYPSASGSSANPAPGASKPQYVSAEEEKAQMRYLEAKRAVEARQQNAPTASAGPPPASGSPVPYEQLFPGKNHNAITQTPPPATSSPSQQPQYEPRSPSPPGPPAPASGATSPPTHARTMSAGRTASEDGYRRQMKPLEAIASLRGNAEGGLRPAPPPRRQTPGVVSPVSPLPTQSGVRGLDEGAGGSNPPGYADLPPGAAPPVRTAYQPPAPTLTAEQEKAQLRARYEEADNADTGGSSSSGWNRAPAAASSAPPPPMDLAPGYGEPSNRPLNAAEEKARLAAQYATDERVANPVNQAPGYGSAPSMSPAPPPPMFDAQFQPGQPTWQQWSPMHQHLETQSSLSQYPTVGGPASPSPPPVAQGQMYGSTPGHTRVGLSGPGPGIATPVATRPSMPASIPSQVSGMSSSEYNNYPQIPSEGRYQLQQGQNHPGYYSTSPVPVSPEDAGWGNGNGYTDGGGQENGAIFMNTGSFTQKGDDAIQPLTRDPTISQGKRRAIEGDVATSPPPLAPRPPVEYIHETERIDASTPAHEREWDNPSAQQYNQSRGVENGVGFGLEVRPFSPLDLSFDQHHLPFERPPLPPKVPI